MEQQQAEASPSGGCDNPAAEQLLAVRCQPLIRRASRSLRKPCTHPQPPARTCSSPSRVATALLSSMPTYRGLRLKLSRARSSTFVVCVALNSIVWRSLGRIFTIWRISSSNPISRMRSASSTTRQARLRKTKPLVFCRWSSRRPGVDTSRLTPLTSRSASVRRLAPPITRPAGSSGGEGGMVWACAAASGCG